MMIARNFMIAAALVTMQSGCQHRPNPDCGKDSGRITLPKGAVVSWNVSRDNLKTSVVLTRTDLDYGFLLDEFNNGKVKLYQIKRTSDLQKPEIILRYVDDSDITPLRNNIDSIVNVCAAPVAQPGH